MSFARLLVVGLLVVFIVVATALAGVGFFIFHTVGLHYAAAINSVAGVRLMLWLGYDIEGRQNQFKDSVATSPLLWAVHSGAIDTTRLLLGAGAQLSGGRNALTAAALDGNLPMSELLLDYANEHDATSSLNSIAASCNPRSRANAAKLEIVRQLLAHGGDPNAHAPPTQLQQNMKIPEPGATPLYRAAYRGCPRFVAVLLENGADKNAMVFGKSIADHLNEGKIPSFNKDRAIVDDIRKSFAQER